MIIGDFILPGIDWVQEQGKGRAEEESLDRAQDWFLIQFVDNSMRRVLDLSLCINLNMVGKVEVEQHLWTSDQNMVCVRGFCQDLSLGRWSEAIGFQEGRF